MRRAEQLYQKVMSLWHQLHVNMKSVVSWNYLQKDIRAVSGWNLDTVRFILFSTTFASTPLCTDPPTPTPPLSPIRYAASLPQSGSRLWETWTLTWPTSWPTARRAVCSRRLKGGKWRKTCRRRSGTAKTCCSTWRAVRWGGMNPSRQKYWACIFSLIVSRISSSAAEKDESVSRAYLSELQGITLRLKETEQRLMRAIETPPPSRLSGDTADITGRIAEQEVSLSTPWCRQQALQSMLNL